MDKMMKAIILVMLMCLGLPLVADNLKITTQSPWQTVKNEKGIAEYSLKYPGTGWPGLVMTTSVVPERHYMLTWKMNSSTMDLNNNLQLSIDMGTPFIYSYVISSGWNCYSAYFYSGKATNAKLRLYINPGKAKELMVQNLKLSEVDADTFTGNLLPDGDFESCTLLPVLWTKSYGTENYPASIVENQDFLAGARSMTIKLSSTSSSSEGVTSIYLPVIPGERVQLSFWAKADAETSINATVELWSPIRHTGKHFYKTGRFKLSTQWTKCIVNVDIPDNLGEYPDLMSKVIRLNFSGMKSAGKIISIDDIVFRMIKK